MLNLSTFPEQDILQLCADTVPAYMRPNKLPLAVVGEGYLSDAECDDIITEMMQIEPHQNHDCGAISRESKMLPVLDPIKDFAVLMNQSLWDYFLDDKPMSWLQTYMSGGDYQLHMDSAPGQMRKLTAVAFLTDPSEYLGGRLTLHFHPASFKVPQTRGTIVVFQPWLLHEVSIVTGIRQTVNMGFWGPPFR